MLLAIALALMVAQGISSGLIWRAQHERHMTGMVNSVAFRLLGQPQEQRRDTRNEDPALRRPPPPDDGFRLPRPLRLRVEPASPLAHGDYRRGDAEHALREVLEAQGVPATDVVVVERDPARDGAIAEWFRTRRRFTPGPDSDPPRLVVAAMRRPDGAWLTARVLVPGDERRILVSILLQTIFIYIVLVGAVALILRRIARPLKALTRRVEAFAQDRSTDGQLAPDGPEDIQRLIAAHNAMELRIVSLLDEKDVMLGAIGHDLKTPLAALRVRIEAVEDDTERGRMAATIEDINRSLDDILSLARVGRPSDPIENTELAALVADVADEYEDMGEDVVLGETERIVLPLRATWLRRAMRNLVSNALRYGSRARVSLHREGRHAVLRIEDDGPGIPESDIGRMMEPFTRLEASRNSATGGTGLGLALARAIAEQHGGSLTLANRQEGGRIAGLTATLRLPLT
ncbi:ATP-binding protein [Novosphingobium sp. KCTC 2891]|nr:ATP-binding protein [Novosphingobium sp. KCTC 2891]MCW1382076.1 ATP-binding protein [Novosphingobium sp. KCTC 2891]